MTARKRGVTEDFERRYVQRSRGSITSQKTKPPERSNLRSVSYTRQSNSSKVDGALHESGELRCKERDEVERTSRVAVAALRTRDLQVIIDRCLGPRLVRAALELLYGQMMPV